MYSFYHILEDLSTKHRSNSGGVFQMGTFKRIKQGLNKKVDINDVDLYKPYQHDEISRINELLQNKCTLHTSKQSFAEHTGNTNKLPTVAVSKNID